jgi:hypothetical protein
MIRRHFPSRLAAALALFAVCATAVAARAETRTHCSGRDCDYYFDDGAVNSPGPSPYGELMKVRGRAPAAGLIRPRVSFVTELLVTVEKF